MSHVRPMTDFRRRRIGGRPTPLGRAPVLPGQPAMVEVEVDDRAAWSDEAARPAGLREEPGSQRLLLRCGLIVTPGRAERH